MRFTVRHKNSFILLSLFLLFVLSACSATHNQTNQHSDERPTAIRGVLDLSKGYYGEIIPLDGEWLFYPDKLVSVNGLAHQPAEAVVQVPSDWREYRINGEPLPSSGTATFALEIHLPELLSGKVWALDIPVISSAYTLQVNNTLIVHNGTVALDESMSKQSRQKRIAYFESDDPILRVVVQVSNAVTQKAGMIRPIHIGEAQFITNESLKRTSIEIFLTGALLIMAVYHFGLYLLRRRERAPLYFGLFCITISLRGMLIGETVIYRFLPELSAELAMRTEYFFLCVSAVSFALFLKRIYAGEISRSVVWATVILSGVYGLMSLFSPLFVLTQYLRYFQYVILITMSYAFYVFVLAVIKKRDGSWISMFGALFLTLAIFNDIFYTIGSIHTGNYTTLGLFIFIICQSFILATTFSKAFASSEDLALELQALNSSLEEKVKLRTRMLEESNRALHMQSIQDGLTGIPNRRYFNEKASELLTDKGPLSLLLIDIDHFKNYNDSLGHLAGDDCLKKVAAVLQSEAKQASSIATRFGGEEFALIAPIELDEALWLANHLVSKVRSLEIPHPASETEPVITISCGVASCGVSKSEDEPRIADLNALIAAADKALYSAKQQGRNRYVYECI